jgi:hypothetical protein
MMLSHHAELWGGPRDGELLHIPSGPDGDPSEEVHVHTPQGNADTPGFGTYRRGEVVKRQAGSVWIYTWKESA